MTASLTSAQLEEVVDAGARGWFDSRQAQRRDDSRLDPKTGEPWQWDDVNESDQRAYRALVRPIVVAALAVAAGFTETLPADWCCPACGHAEPHDVQRGRPRPGAANLMCRVAGCGCPAPRSTTSRGGA